MRLGYAALFLESTPFAVRDFDTWIVLSMIIVPHAHLVVVACAARYARALVRNFPYRPENAGVGGALASVGYATAMSAVPGIVLIGIPPALTAVTGLVFIPAMYALARHWIAGDRRIEARCASDSSQAGNAALT
jgi:hypothetical protein